MRRRLALLPSLALLTALAACGADSTEDDDPRGGTSEFVQPSESVTTNSPAETPEKDVTGEVEVSDVVVNQLEAPWGLDFLPDERAVVTERDTRKVLLIDGGEVSEIGDFGQLPQFGESGLLGVAVSPDFEDDNALYFYVTTAQDNRIVRRTLEGDRLGDSEPILTGIPRAFTHDGGRLIFGPDGHLYASTGDAQESSLAQDPTSLAGKILRIGTDGNPVSDNPDPESPVFTSGHRNVQGLAFDDDGNLWASEFGSDQFDELNLIEAGNNYGWPEVEGAGGGSEFTDPQVTWPTSKASPSGLAWHEGRLWMASLRGERLWAVTVEDGEATGRKAWFVGEYGRLRTVAVAPDDTLWLTTSNRDTRGNPGKNDDRILALTVS